MNTLRVHTKFNSLPAPAASSISSPVHSIFFINWLCKKLCGRLARWRKKEIHILFTLTQLCVGSHGRWKQGKFAEEVFLFSIFISAHPKKANFQSEKKKLHGQWKFSKLNHRLRSPLDAFSNGGRNGKKICVEFNDWNFFLHFVMCAAGVG